MFMAKKKNVNEPTNGGEEFINLSLPYRVSVTLEGTSDLLFHRWNCEAVEAKAALKRGSAGKKMDDIESFVYRDEEGNLCLPGEYLRMSIVNAAKYKTDPRSTRKSAMDLYKAAIIILNPLASLGVKNWDYEDKRRVVIQKSGINRIRPAMQKGWKATFEIMVNLPEYVEPQELQEVIAMAGRLVGLADFRPTFGRFIITNFEILKD